MFSLLLSGVKSAQASSANWRSISRGAHENLATKNYAAAESGFLKAIEVLQNENPKADELYGLQLLLVETYREEKDYQKAREWLNLMEPAIKANNFVDPTVAVRFWRRKADVEFSSGSKSLGIQYHRKAIAILEKHFEPNSPTLTKNYLALLQIASANSDYGTIVEILNKVKSIDSQTASQILERGFADLLKGSCMLADRGSFPEAFRLIQGVRVASFLLPGKTALYSEYSLYCKSHGYDQASNEMCTLLLDLSKEVDAKLSANERTDCLIKIHIALATIFAKPDPDKNGLCIHHWRKAEILCRELKQPLTMEQQLQRSIVINSLVLARGLGRSTDEAIKMLQEPINFSVLSGKQSLSPEDLGKLRLIHIGSRICLALVYLHAPKAEPTKSEAALSSIDSEALKVHPVSVGKLMVAEIYVDIARLYKVEKNISKCDRALAMGKTLVKGLPDSPQLANFWKKYREVQEISDSKSAQ